MRELISVLNEWILIGALSGLAVRVDRYIREIALAWVTDRVVTPFANRREVTFDLFNGVV